MPYTPDLHDAHDYAERIRERLPLRLRARREASGLSKHALTQNAGVSRDMVCSIENGESINCSTKMLLTVMLQSKTLTPTQFVTTPFL